MVLRMRTHSRRLMKGVGWNRRFGRIELGTDLNYQPYKNDDYVLVSHFHGDHCHSCY